MWNLKKLGHENTSGYFVIIVHMEDGIMATNGF